ncbi:putative peptidase A1 family protein [Lyophyllum shimeji]|uniref:Peptidase A1 family protein n=1 Tax=Lyophyllum shimeji TaxID=47721 RepID=A0A9P3PMY7_LYOSH|nr:putative peptidase A1 family protein [Lyophyllum shimeji]
MRSRFLIPLALLLTILDATHGIKVPFQIRTGNHAATRLARRSTIPVANNGNAQYIGNMTLGGVQARVLLDTGSSDLWASFQNAQPTGTDLGKAVSLAYAVGKAAGNVHATTAELGGFKVDNQAFLLVSDTSTFSTDIHVQGYDGLLGLGPNKGSVIRKKLDGNTGDTLLTHIFQQNQSDSYITFLLDRKSDPGDAFTGQLTIGEVAKGFENITSMPKLDVDTVNRLLSSDQHWQALTDKDMGIIGPDGNPIQVKSIVPSAPDGQFVAVFDSGFTFSQVPRDVSDAIYGRVRGAVYDTKDELWTVPCGQYLNISVQFGGRAYPIHPLDTVDDNFGKTDSQGNRVCIGAFQPITSAFSLLGHYDMILGMSFLRNAYTLLDFGSWANGQSGDHPFIQLASVTNAAQARQDFINVRLGGTDTTNDPKWALLPPDQMQHSPVSEEEKKKKYQELVLSRWPYILTGCLVAVLGIVGFCVWRCCRRKGAKKAGKSKKLNQLLSTEPASTTYLPLQGQGGATHKGDHSPGLSPGGQYHAHAQSQYSLDSQYPPGPQYPPDSRYSGQHGAHAEYYNAGQHPSEQWHSDAGYLPPQHPSGHPHPSYGNAQ